MENRLLRGLSFLPKDLNPSTINQTIELSAFQPDFDALPTGLLTYIERTQESRSQLFVCFDT